MPIDVAMAIVSIAHNVLYNYIRHVSCQAADASSLPCKCRIQVMGWILFKAETSWVGWVQNFWVELGLFEKVANARL